MYKCIAFVFKLFAVLMLSSNLYVSANSSIGSTSLSSILFIYPVDKGFPFWDSQLNFATAVANAYNLNLKVAYTPAEYRNRFDAANYINQQITAMKHKPSLVITSFWVGSEQKILSLLDKQQIPLITINSDLSEQQFLEFGKPRTKYKLWLAHFSPNDTLAGQILTQAIVSNKRKLKCPNKTTCEVNIFAVTGLSYSAVSKQRANGLTKQIRSDKKANLLSLVYGNWDRNLVKTKTPTILRRHNDIDAFWFASDVMAYGLIDGAKTEGITLNKDTVIGGIDWSPATINMIRTGQMHVSLGGHFMEAGWGLILFHDYLNGVKLPLETTSVIKTEMSLLSKENLDELGPFLDNPHWSRHKLRSYSKHLNPTLTHYNLNPKSVILDQLTQEN